MTLTSATLAGRQVAANPLIAKRYRADRRFRVYGIVALCVSAVFLLLLFVDILSKGLPAFTEHRLVLRLTVDRAVIDPNDTKDPKVIAGGDFTGLVRGQLASIFPQATSRAGRKKLTGLLSSGAAANLRTMVLADPSLISREVGVSVLLSDDADQYLKGYQTAIVRMPGQTTMTIAANGERYDLAVSPPGISGLTSGDILRANGGAFRVTAIESGVISGEPAIAPRSLDPVQPGNWDAVRFTVPESNRRVDDQAALYLEELRDRGQIERGFAWRFLTSGDSREAELAGIRGALVGSALMLFVTLALCLPIGVAAAIYLEEFAARNRLTQIIEVNINNLAAVPSIVFGLLGLAMFLNFFGLPRSAPLVGGLVLALLVLPTIIIAARAALRAVPPSIKEAAFGVGASHQQAIFHHVLPLAMPGIMTGTIIGMAHALGETAPLLMIGMVAFIVDVPSGFSDAATALPVQIYLWSDLPENAFQAKTAAAIIVLLVFLFIMNAAAILLRRRFERRW
ncbi:MAG: phosphate ABC transporter permease PstA [Pseudomonadota bacterium]|nr:phosphate ABC transporter permease PstA [Pseudomonadota bacterium]